MKRITICLVVMLTIFTLFSGCTSTLKVKDNPVPVPNTDTSKIESIPFLDNQLYAVAYLGYNEMDELSFYIEKYLDSDNIPIHYLSQGEYYLVIPRYSNMILKLYKNDMETMQSTLIFEEKEGRPFIIQCNISDIFPDITVSLTYNEEIVEFSPYVSLKDGTIMVGERGLNVTK